MRVYSCNPSQIERLAFNFDSSYLFATTSNVIRFADHAVVPWALGTDDAPQFLDCGVVVDGVYPLPTGQLLVSGWRTTYRTLAVQVVDPRRMDPVISLPNCDRLFRIAVSPTGDQFLAQSRNPSGQPVVSSFRLPLNSLFAPEWVVNGLPKHDRKLEWLTDVRLGRDGPEVLLVEKERPDSSSRYSSARLGRRSTNTGNPLGLHATLPKAACIGTHFAANGSRLLGFDKAALFSFDLETPKNAPANVTSGVRKHFTALAVHPDGKRVFATCNDGTVREYDAVTLQERRAYNWKVGRVRCVAVAPDGLTAAAGSDTGKDVVWDLD